MPLFWLSLAFLVGIIIADIVTLPLITWLILAVVSLGLALTIFVIRRIRAHHAFQQTSPSSFVALVPLLLISLTFGGLRYQISLPDLSDPAFIAAHNDTGERVSLTGVVDSFPDLRDNYLLDSSIKCNRVGVEKIPLQAIGSQGIF